MRLFEFAIFETSDEDRALVSLSDAITNYINSAGKAPTSDKPLRIGKIGDLFDTPIEILNPIDIQLQTPSGLSARQGNGPAGKSPVGLWSAGPKTITMNSDYIGSNVLRSTITHELRHALDDFKSSFKANATGGSYSIPKKKEHRSAENTKYLAEPAEINARFLQVMHAMVPAIKRAVKLLPDQIEPSIMRDFNRSMNTHHIAELFPEKEQSRDYKRLIKRAMSFIQKEYAHAKEELAKQTN